MTWHNPLTQGDEGRGEHAVTWATIRQVLPAPPARVVPHTGSCGTRCPAPCGRDLGNVAEMLRNGTTVCHGCGGRFRPGDPPICGGAS